MVRKMHAKVHKNRRITKIIIRFYLRKNLFLGDFDFIDHRLYNIDQLLTGCLARCDHILEFMNYQYPL